MDCVNTTGRTGNIVEYFVDDGIGGNQFNDRSSSVTSERMLVFGGTYGVTYFNPRYSSKHRKIDVLFESLKIYDEDIRPDQDKCIKQSLNYNPDIYLNYKQRSFSISFAALDYGEFSNVQYYYKIEGYDKYWIKSGSDHVAIYSNLPSGNYIFKVKITSNDVNNVIGSKSIRIHVIRAPWFAMVGYHDLCIISIIDCCLCYKHQQTNTYPERNSQTGKERKGGRMGNESDEYALFL